MRPEIAQQLPALRDLCIKHRIRELSLFGSAVSDDPSAFDPARSDFDFLVEFLDDDLGPWMKRYSDFKNALEALLGRNVDVMFTDSPGTPYIWASINSTKVPLYAAAA